MARQRCARLVRGPAPDCPNIISVDPAPVDLTGLRRKRWGGGGRSKIGGGGGEATQREGGEGGGAVIAGKRC